MTNSFTNIFTGSPVQPATVSYVAYDINSFLTPELILKWPTQFIDTPNVVANIINVSVNVDNYQIFMPDATEASVGQTIIFVNVSGGSFSFDVLGNQDEFIVTVNVGESVMIYLIDNSTADGTWMVIPFGGGFSAVTSVAAVSLTSGLTITGSPITSAGTLSFSLSPSLVSLAGLGTAGFLVQTSVGTITARDIIGGANIDVTNDDGVAGNPVINLSDSLTSLTSLDVGSFNISGNTISTVSGNTNIVLAPNGTGSILLGNGLTPPTIDSNANLFNVHILTVTNGASIAEIGIASNIITTLDILGNLTISAASTGVLTLKGASNTHPLQIDANNNLFHPSTNKAWVVFNAAGTIINQFNVTSVVKGGTGQYTITIFGGLLGTQGLAMGSVFSGAGTALVANTTATSLTTFSFNVKDTTNTFTDPTTAYCVISGV